MLFLNTMQFVTKIKFLGIGASVEFYIFDENMVWYAYLNKSELNGPNWVLNGCTRHVL